MINFDKWLITLLDSIVDADDRGDNAYDIFLTQSRMRDIATYWKEMRDVGLIILPPYIEDLRKLNPNQGHHGKVNN